MEQTIFKIHLQVGTTFHIINLINLFILGFIFSWPSRFGSDFLKSSFIVVANKPWKRVLANWSTDDTT